MKAVYSTDPSNPAQSLISSICYSQLHKFTTAATTWGCEHEAIARMAYIKMASTMHENFEYCDSGLFVSKDLPFIGASPDGIVQCSCCGHGIGVLEIKCPYCIREEDPT